MRFFSLLKPPQPAQPYSFGYDTVDEYGNQQFHSERGGADNGKIGSYGYRDINGLYRRVNYVADAKGFRATVDTNEPGTASGASADVVFNKAPVVAPVPAGAAVYVSRGVPAPYGARLPGPYLANRYGGYRRYGRYPYGPVAGAYGHIPYRRYGYSPNRPAVGGYSYGGHGFYNYGGAEYATGYAPLGYGAPIGYGTWPSGYYGYKRR
ncbi:hypothetical protein V5799_031479 [Amblyomma americanum]|uniref:Cuticle protein n=1 Tax=Amblyomma americanum TaxID=6943 RepID=A0AAQ4EK91_AMBAM